MHRESDLLFALLAAHLGFAARESLLESVFAWLSDPARPLADRLCEAAGLSARRRRAVEAVADAALEAASGDAARALADAPVDPGLAQALVACRLPAHLQAALAGAAAREAGGFRYRLGAEIGRGGLGRVVEATDTRLARDVAVKLVLADMPDAMAERFAREARLTARLDHPHVVPVHDFGEVVSEGRRELFLCMKRIRGRDLGELIDAIARGEGDGAWSRARLLGVFQDICLGVAYAHSKGVIHRDLKPSNVMIGDFGETLIVDWGLAKALGEAEPVEVSRMLSRITTTAPGKPAGGVSPRAKTLVSATQRPSSSTLTLEGDVLGTPAYMPPEQAEGRIAEMDPRSDIWSLGAILYEILTLRPPFEGESIEDVLAKVSRGQFTPPSVRVAELAAARGGGRPHPFLAPVPPELDAVVARAMAFRREDRPSSALDLHREVQLFLEGVRERERREREAAELVEAGRRGLASFTELGDRLPALTQRVKTLNEELSRTDTMESRRVFWDAEAEQRRVEVERIDAFSRANAAFGQALALAPELAPAREGKCELLVQRYLDAEKRRDRNEMLFQWNALAQYDRDGRSRARLQAPGRLSLRVFVHRCDCLAPVKKKGWRVEFSEDCPVTWHEGLYRPGFDPGEGRHRCVPRVTLHPSSAKFGHRADCPMEEVRGVGVAVSRYEEKDHRYVAGPDTLVGRTPLENVTLPQGSYRCILTPPSGSGLAPAFLPVRIRRDAAWSQDVRLYRESDVPEGCVLVPGGPFASGFAADETDVTADFFASRTHVTCRQYLEFLNDLCARGRLEEARERQPRGSDRPYWREARSHGEVRFRLPTPEEDRQLAWHEAWPVFAVTWHDALAWCAWRSALDGRVVTLPVGPEFEKASRGVDGRAFPFGDQADYLFANAARAGRGLMGPLPAGTNPIDESPYGVRDMAGNVQTWCFSRYSGPARDARETRGGAWSLSLDSGMSAGGAGHLATSRRWFTGFRTVVRARAYEAT